MGCYCKGSPGSGSSFNSTKRWSWNTTSVVHIRFSVKGTYVFGQN